MPHIISRLGAGGTPALAVAGGFGPHTFPKPLPYPSLVPAAWHRRYDSVIRPTFGFLPPHLSLDQEPWITPPLSGLGLHHDLPPRAVSVTTTATPVNAGYDVAFNNGAWVANAQNSVALTYSNAGDLYIWVQDEYGESTVGIASGTVVDYASPDGVPISAPAEFQMPVIVASGTGYWVAARALVHDALRDIFRIVLFEVTRPVKAWTTTQPYASSGSEGDARPSVAVTASDQRPIVAYHGTIGGATANSVLLWDPQNDVPVEIGPPSTTQECILASVSAGAGLVAVAFETKDTTTTGDPLGTYAWVATESAAGVDISAANGPTLVAGKVNESDTTTRQAWDPSVVVLATGDVVVAWQQKDRDGGCYIWNTRSTDQGRTWPAASAQTQTTEALSTGSVANVHYFAAMAANGDQIGVIAEARQDFGNTTPPSQLVQVGGGTGLALPSTADPAWDPSDAVARATGSPSFPTLAYGENYWWQAWIWTDTATLATSIELSWDLRL